MHHSIQAFSHDETQTSQNRSFVSFDDFCHDIAIFFFIQSKGTILFS